MPTSAKFLVTMAALALFSSLFTWVAMHFALVPWRRSAGRHWTERARLLWPARRSLIWISIACSYVGMQPVNRWVPDIPLYLVVPAVAAGVLLGSFPCSREIEPRHSFKSWLRQTAWVLGYSCGFFGIGVWLAITMPPVMDAAAWVRTSCGLAGAAFLASGVWLPLVAATRRAHPAMAPVKERLERIAARASEISGICPRHVWLMPTPTPNAVAIPYVRGVAFSTRIMEELDDGECLTVMLHEFGHLRESVGVLLLRLLGSMSLFVFVFFKPVRHWAGPFTLVLLLVAYLVLVNLTNRLRRRMECRADRAAIGEDGCSPAYARALEKIHECGNIPAVMRGNRQVHPHLYDRMLAAGVTPSYPRPEPPVRFSWVAWACLATVAACILANMS